MSGIWVAFYLLKITCPILSLTGIPCPTCGTTRALLSLLRGDIKNYLYYQPMAVPMTITVVLCMHIRIMRRACRKIAVAIIGITLAVNTAIYVGGIAGYI